MNKNELIAAIQAAGQRLGRDVDVQGSKAELEMRLQELQEELDGDDRGEDAPAGNKNSPENAGALPAGDDLPDAVPVTVLQTLHLCVLKNGFWRTEVVVPGEVAIIHRKNLGALSDAGLVVEHAF
ncbi:hypothetical protein MKO37_000011 [Salmonella enterica]|nr:hypothetical protein [Salmonella enterica]